MFKLAFSMITMLVLLVVGLGAIMILTYYTVNMGKDRDKKIEERKWKEIRSRKRY